MKKLLLVLIVFTLQMDLKAQLDDGTYYFISSSHYLAITLEEGGWIISNVLIIDMQSGTREIGSGSWHKINLQGADENYNGPDGFYEFQTDYCSYDFNAPSYFSETIEFNRSECDLSGSLFMTQSTEIEAGMTLNEMMYGSFEDWSDEQIDGALDDDYAEYTGEHFEEEETNEFDFEWANYGYEEIEAKLLPWITKTGTELQKAILNFQPTLAECKAVFSDEDYIAVYASVTAAYAEIINDAHKNPEKSMGYKYIRVQPIIFEQPYIKLYPGKGPFKLRTSQLDYYKFTFLNSEASEFGRSITIIVKVGDRYVIFPQY